jgi:multicomponent Na+:H+ antiporter subunit E
MTLLARLGRALAFALFFARELLVANLRVAWLVLRPRRQLRPAIVAVPLDVRGDLAIQLLATTITLTPGTLSLDIASDRRTLYVHVVDLGPAGDVDAFVRGLKATFERRIKELCE